MKLTQQELYAALGLLIDRIEHLGASTELTAVSMFACEIKNAVGNEHNRANAYDANRVRVRLGLPERTVSDECVTADCWKLTPEDLATLRFAKIAGTTVDDVAAYLYSAFTCGAEMTPVPWEEFIAPENGNEDKVAAWRHLAEAVRHVVRPGSTTFARDLARVINCYSVDSVSNTPDHILADYIVGCIRNWNEATRAREQWYAGAESCAKEPQPVVSAEWSEVRTDAPVGGSQTLRTSHLQRKAVKTGSTVYRWSGNPEVTYEDEGSAIKAGQEGLAFAKPGLTPAPE